MIPDTQAEYIARIKAFSTIFNALSYYKWLDNTLIFGSLAKQYATFKQTQEISEQCSALDIDICVKVPQGSQLTSAMIRPLLSLSKEYYGALDPFFLLRATNGFDSFGHARIVDDLLVRNEYATGVVYAKRKRELLKAIKTDGVPLSEFLGMYWNPFIQNQNSARKAASSLKA